MDYKSKYTGYQVEQLLDKAGNSVQSIKIDSTTKTPINGVLEFNDIATKDFCEKTVGSKIFIGSQEQYIIANRNGEISIGALVIITDGNIENDNNNDYSETSAILGKAIIGTLLLGKS